MPKLFVMLVMMALVTTLATTPVLLALGLEEDRGPLITQALPG